MDKELIDHITSKLQSHEENYSPGAWERFSEPNKKPKAFIYWPLWTAAALILIFGGLFIVLNQKGIKNEMVVVPTVKKKAITNNGTGVVKTKDTVIKNTIAEKPIVNFKETEVDHKSTEQLAGTTPENKLTPSPSVLVNSDEQNRNLIGQPIGINLAAHQSVALSITAKIDKQQPVKKLSFEDLLAQDSKLNHDNKIAKTKQPSKWEPGVYIAPAMGNDSKVNMNYGFSLSYALAKNLAISSGISYASLSSTENTGTNPQAVSGKNLASVNAKVQGLNIPIELKYNITDKLYTGIGVSALAVLSNSQSNDYLISQVQSMPSVSVNGISEQKTYIIQEKTVEPQPESTINPDQYVGFYNFSLGYKQKISPKKHISVEPFLRLPMKTFSKENLNLTNGGLRLKIDF